MFLAVPQYFVPLANTCEMIVFARIVPRKLEEEHVLVDLIAMTTMQELHVPQIFAYQDNTKTKTATALIAIAQSLDVLNAPYFRQVMQLIA